VRPFVDQSAVDMPFGNPRLAQVDGIIFAQWMTLELVVQEDSPEVRMIGKVNTV
jgi:hypothetical protein